MLQAVTISIDESTGDYRFLVNESTIDLVTAESNVKRASHVEPWNPVLRLVFNTIRLFSGDLGYVAEWTRLWPFRWRVNLSPVGGPLVPVEWANRESAIKFEVSWLEENFL